MKVNAATDVAAVLVDQQACELRWRLAGDHGRQHRCTLQGEHRMHLCDCTARLQLDEGKP